MVHSRSTWLYSLSFVSLTWASTFQTTLRTASARDSLQADIPEPTSGPGTESLGLEPRADSATGSEAYKTNLSGGAVLTSSASAHVCGYIDGAVNSGSVECMTGGQCVIHTSGSRYPNMMGCCYDSDPSNCRFETACYDSSKLKATPSLTSSLNVNFDVLCVRELSSACVTWTYPELDMTDYGCGPTATLQTIYLTASRSQSQYRTISGYYYYTTIMTAEPIAVNDAFIRNYDNVNRSAFLVTETGAPRASTSGLSGTSLATSTSSHSSGSGSGGHSKSSNTGAIVGGVVGGVVGLVAIICAIWACIWYARKKKQNPEGTYPSAPVQPYMQSMPPAAAEAEGTLGKPAQRYSAVAPPPYTAELPAGDSYFNPHDTGSPFVAELTAGAAEPPQYQRTELDGYTDQTRPIGRQYYGR
ncbi:hypothetical protein N7448_006699 [Penicillium atrosanguineum]|nr:hypothetical protein N7448_006699 [Penicillium atrosanguineum]